MCEDVLRIYWEIPSMAHILFDSILMRYTSLTAVGYHEQAVYFTLKPLIRWQTVHVSYIIFVCKKHQT